MSIFIARTVLIAVIISEPTDSAICAFFPISDTFGLNLVDIGNKLVFNDYV